MKEIAIFGAGGFGREVASLIKRINEKCPTWKFVGFFDDCPSASDNEYGKVLGNMESLNNLNREMAVVIAVAKPVSIKSIHSRLNNPLLYFPNIIAPEAYFLDPGNYSLGKGNIISSFTSLSCNVKIGDFNVINNRVSFGHDANIGDYNVFMTAGRISGNVSIGEGNLFGVGSIVLPGIKIGNNTTVSPGSVIIRPTKDNNVYIGNPAKIFKV